MKFLTHDGLLYFWKKVKNMIGDTSKLSNGTNLVDSINGTYTKLNTIEQGAQVNTVTGVKGSSEASYRTGNVNITKANIGLGSVDNTADSNKSVKYATSAGSAGNSDTVDGFHIQASTTDLTPNVSSLASNVIYCVYK